MMLGSDEDVIESPIRKWTGIKKDRSWGSLEGGVNGFKFIDCGLLFTPKFTFFHRIEYDSFICTSTLYISS